ncbi:MAG: HepT-like ribonuclease domain-containing protein [bacterium]
MPKEKKDTKTVYAVLRAIEVIGEATKNIPDEIRKKYPEIP